MKHITWVITTFAVLLLAGLASASKTGSITGRVLDANTHAPVAGATVLVQGTHFTTRTGTDGTYTILNVPPGVYVVRVDKPGVLSLLQRVTVTAGQTVTVDFNASKLLEKKKDESPREDTQALGRDGRGAPVPPGVRSTANLHSLQVPQSLECEAPYGWYQPGNESYDAVAENTWASPTNRPLSTFSVDVDAASYSNVRRFITGGQLPPVDAVRVEELINYFDYDYPNPRGRDPFSITTEVADCPWNPGSKLVHIGLQGRRIAVEKLPASNLVFLIDVSGSMNSPDKLPLLKSSFRMFVDQLRRQDRVAIVVYAGNAGLVLESTPGSDKEEILCAIDRLEAGGSTAGGEGIKLAYRIAQQNFLEGGNNRIILATDGDFNVGMSSDEDMVRLIEDKRRSGVFLTVLGFGQGNLKDSKMEKIADKGNGHYAYIDNIAEARKVLVNEMGATVLTIAKDVKLQVEFNPARVASYRLVGYENRVLQDRDFDDDSKDAGEIGAGHSVTALYEITLTGRNGPRPLKYADKPVHEDARHSTDLLTVSFRYKEPTASESRLLSHVVADRNTRCAEASDAFRFSAAVAEFGMILRDSSQKGDATMRQVIALAKSARGEDEHGYRAEFISLAETAEALLTTVSAR